MKDKKVAPKNSTKGKKKNIRPVSMKHMIDKSARAFEKAVAELKEEHPGDTVQINLLTDSAVMRAVSAWAHVGREVRFDAYEMTDPWKMIWYAPGPWMEAARVPRSEERGVMLAIRQNHLVYPDGTLPKYVERYLIECGRSLLGLPPTKEPERGSDEKPGGASENE